MNVSGTLSFFRLFRDPSLCLPHHTVSTFNHLPIPLSRAFTKADSQKKVDIRAVVIDKDNCFAVPKENEVYKPYTERFEELRKAYPGNRLLIVSNSAGTLSDPTGAEADLLEKNTGVKVLRHNTKVCDFNVHTFVLCLKTLTPDLLEKNTGVKVLRHNTKKPGCYADVLSYLRNAPDTGVTHPSQVAIVGDRLFTDVMMANMMGSYGFWIRDGVVEEKGLFVRLERSLEGFLTRRGYVPPSPQNQFE